MAEAAAVVEMGEEIKTAVAADVLRTLVTAGYIEEIAMQHALDTLAVAGFYVDIPPRLKPWEYVNLQIAEMSSIGFSDEVMAGLGKRPFYTSQIT